MENSLLVNLLGKQFHLPCETVANYPETLLGNKILLSKYYRIDRKDYYFERNPLLFPYIFMYFTFEKKIFCPHHIPIELLEKECQFFQLNDPLIYPERTKIPTYHYFSRKQFSKEEYFIDMISFISGLIFMINISIEKTPRKTLSWSLSYFLELFSTLLLTSSIIYQIMFLKDFFRKKSFFFDLFSIILSTFIITSENLLIITDYSFINILSLTFKILRLLIFIGHLRILRLIIQTLIQEFSTIFILIFINIIIVGSFSEITFAFERQQKQGQTDSSAMKTHLDAFWWAISLSFTIGFGHTNSHATLTLIGRICSYMLIFVGLLFNGLILQELIRGFLKIYREERRDD